jgi:hypothetical protein
MAAICLDPIFWHGNFNNRLVEEERETRQQSNNGIPLGYTEQIDVLRLTPVGGD